MLGMVERTGWVSWVGLGVVERVVGSRNGLGGGLWSEVRGVNCSPARHVALLKNSFHCR